MSVLAVLAVGAFPEPAELLRLDGLDEVFADDLGRVSFSIVWMERRKGRTSVVVRGFPVFDNTKLRSFSSSHLSMVSR